MTQRKDTPLHRKWHKRVDGQIIDCMRAHPRWFSYSDERDRKMLINSLSKRIVGEIVAAYLVANSESSPGFDVGEDFEGVNDAMVLVPERRCGTRLRRLFNSFKEMWNNELFPPSVI